MVHRAWSRHKLARLFRAGTGVLTTAIKEAAVATAVAATPCVVEVGIFRIMAALKPHSHDGDCSESNG